MFSSENGQASVPAVNTTLRRVAVTKNSINIGNVKKQLSNFSSSFNKASHQLDKLSSQFDQLFHQLDQLKKTFATIAHASTQFDSNTDIVAGDIQNIESPSPVLSQQSRNSVEDDICSTGQPNGIGSVGNDEAYSHQNVLPSNPCSISISDYSGSDFNSMPGDEDVTAFLEDVECTPYSVCDDSESLNVPIISAEQKEQGEYSNLHTSQDES